MAQSEKRKDIISILYNHQSALNNIQPIHWLCLYAFIAFFYVLTLCITQNYLCFYTNFPPNTKIRVPQSPSPMHHWTHSVYFSLDFNFQPWSTTFQHRPTASLHFISMWKKSSGLWSGKWGKLINLALINDSGKAFYQLCFLGEYF